MMPLPVLLAAHGDPGCISAGYEDEPAERVPAGADSRRGTLRRGLAVDARVTLTRGAKIDGPKLTLGKLSTAGGDDTLAFKGAMTLPTTPALDPVATWARVIVDGVLDATIPGGAFAAGTKTGWKAGKHGSFSYRNGAGGIGGIAKVDLKGSAKKPGSITFTVAGKTGSYTVDPAHLPRQATLSIDAGTGQCGDANFPGPPPAPDCVYKAKSGKMQCK